MTVKKLKNIRNDDVRADHLIIKEETICHVSVILGIEAMQLFMQSVRHVGNTVQRF